MKKSILILATLFLFSCSAPNNEDSNITIKKEEIHPPTWLQGNYSYVSTLSEGKNYRLFITAKSIDVMYHNDFIYREVDFYKNYTNVKEEDVIVDEVKEYKIYANDATNGGEYGLIFHFKSEPQNKNNITFVYPIGLTFKK